MTDPRMIGKTKVSVKISDCIVSNKSHEVITTHGLGSCIAVAMWDRKAKIGGMLHFQLPTAGEKKDTPGLNKAMYGDTGIIALLTQMGKMGAHWDSIRTVLVGGATINSSEDNDYFAVGKRNIMVAKKMLWNNKLLIDAEHVGGDIARTLYLCVETGSCWLTSGGHHGIKIEL
jgi:chemotaxis protein CheD